MPTASLPISYHATSYSARYTFSGKERDEETGYSYFDARYYNSTYSIWLSVDPMSDKYPSLSPYAYCADNPIKLVDSNGEDIWIVGEDGNNYKYENGNIYTKEGKLYTPESGTFLSEAKNSIDILNGTMTGNKLLSAFEGSNSQDVFIERGIESKCGDYTIEAATGAFISQTILWNPMGRDLPTTAGIQKNATTDLGHELSHVWDNAKNIQGLDDLCPQNGTRSEWRAVYKENLIRGELGMPYRTGYTFKNSDKNYFVPMLNKKGEPYMPNSIQWTPFEICKRKTN